jgi:hypothetical protein
MFVKHKHEFRLDNTLVSPYPYAMAYGVLCQTVPHAAACRYAIGFTLPLWYYANS